MAKEDAFRGKVNRNVQKRIVAQRRRRIRPAVRAARRQAKAARHPVPPPPPRRPGAARRPAVNRAAGGVTPELKQRFDSVQRQFTQLEGDAQLAALYTAVGNIDARLVSLPNKLDELRSRGYVHSGQLEDLLEDIDDRWDEIRPRVDSTLRTQVQQLDRSLDMAERQLMGIRALNAGTLTAAETAVNALSNQISAARQAVTGLYDGLENELDKIEWQIQQVEKMLDLLEQSPEIQLRETEAPIKAVKAQWQQHEDEGPNGYLFLTDQRLLFEQREEIVTKKMFGFIKAESETVQKLLLDLEVAHLEQINHKREGGFLGMGKDDILELVFTAEAPISRARFHLDGQRSEEWAALLKRVQSGDIDEDRADEYEDEVEEAEAVMLQFPEACPNCFAPLPTPPRGVTSVTCEFCSSVILPKANE